MTTQAAVRRKILKVESVDGMRRHCARNPNNTCSLLKFGAKWCGPCQEVHPKVESWLAEEAPECIEVFEADADEADDLFEQFKIRGIPTFVVLRKDLSIAETLVTSDFAKVRIAVNEHVARSVPGNDF